VAQFKYLGTTLQIKTWFKRKFRGVWIKVMLANIQSRTFCFLVCCLET
jgi:hypothetical protein